MENYAFKNRFDYQPEGIECDFWTIDIQGVPIVYFFSSNQTRDMAYKARQSLQEH